MTEVTPGAATSAQPSGPYPGLKPFSEEDSEFFFGRERDSEIIVANLRARRLTVLYGPSGVGKSSVLRAGCVASLRSGAQAARARSGRARSAPVVFDEWKDDPVAGIVDAVKRSVQELLGANEPGPPPTGDLVRDLIAWSHHLAGELLIVLDQFEELFGYQPTPGGAGSFDEQLARAVSTDALPASFLISLREDALALLDDRFKRRLPGLLENRLRVAHLDRESARDAIVKPIERYDALHGTAIEIEPALVEEVLDQVIHLRTSLEQTGAGAVNGGGDPERSMVATPYLQLVVSRLWDEEQRAGSTVLRLLHSRAGWRRQRDCPHAPGRGARVASRERTRRRGRSLPVSRDALRDEDRATGRGSRVLHRALRGDDPAGSPEACGAADRHPSPDRAATGRAGRPAVRDLPRCIGRFDPRLAEPSYTERVCGLEKEAAESGERGRRAGGLGSARSRGASEEARPHVAEPARVRRCPPPCPRCGRRLSVTLRGA